MATNNKFIYEIPSAPEEVNLTQSIGIIPKIASFTTVQSYVDRLRIHDPVIRVYAIKALINKGVRFNDEVLTVAMHVAQMSSYVRQLLVLELIRLFRFDLIDRIIEMEKQLSDKVGELPKILMQKQFENNYAEQVALHELLFLQTGDMYHANLAANISRERLPWKEALKHNIRLLFLQNEHTLQSSLLNLMQFLERESAKDVFMALSPIIHSLEEHKLVRVYIIAMKYYWNKDYENCINFLKTSNALESLREQTFLISNIAAKCYEKLGDYKKSAIWYELQNKAQVDERYKPEVFIQRLNERANLENPKPIPDKHDRYFIMTGFPRSGTTLLENALNAHPDIATCEETSSMIGSFNTAFTAPMEKDPECTKLMLRLAFHQSLYYKDIDRFVNKPDAKAIIDKTPIISANIKYMEKILPNKHYIFSIRHPYDVVLSNIKQVYAQNSAMTAFNDIHNACILYNKVMSDWFDVFPRETGRVCYIKYDDLVMDFRQQMERAIRFLGVEWTDEVLNFVKHAEQRPVRTPSYDNVRKGLTIGVQSSWKNFEFLFDDRCHELLDPWVKKFGYSL